MSTGSVRVGIVGATVDRGWGWRSHIPALRSLPELDLAAVCTAHQETAEAAAAATGARHAFSDYRALIACPDVDLVTIAVRVPWHREMALAAIQAGKHVYCEWPLGTNLTEVEEMAAAARARGVRAMPGLQGRAAPWALHLKQLISEGYVGRVLTANARLTMGHPYMRAGVEWAALRSNGNHILSIQAAHMLDIASQCLGDFRDVSAQITTMYTRWAIPDSPEAIEADAPDCVMVRATTQSGAILSAHFAYIPNHGNGWRLEIYGDQGVLVASSPGPAMVLPNRIEGARAGDRNLQELPVPENLVAVPADYPRDSSFHVAHMYRRLAKAIRDESPPEPDFDTALSLYRLLGVIEQSDRAQGARVQVA
jgi:predicted dehydrogenase